MFDWNAGFVNRRRRGVFADASVWVSGAGLGLAYGATRER
jgi:hypothetical protein